jgi:drug/metabolite transporter (DMT)-like permease
MRLKADLTLLFVSIIWGSAFAAQRVIGEMGNVFLFNGLRFLLGALLLWPFLRGKSSLGRPGWKWVVIAGTVLFIASALQQAGLMFTTAGNAGFITSLYVVLVPIVLFFGWKERPFWTQIVAVFLAIGGGYLLSTGGEFHIQPGDLLELAGAFFWAFHVVMLGKFASRYDALRFSAGQFLVSGVLNIGVGAFTETIPMAQIWLFAGAVLYTAIFSVAVGYTLQVWAQRHTPPTDAAILLSLEAVFAVLFGWLLLGEFLSPVQAIGCGLIFIAVLLAQIRFGRNSLF